MIHASEIVFLYALQDARHLRPIRPYWAVPGLCWLPPDRGAS